MSILLSRPTLAISIMVIVAVIAGGVFLWVAAPGAESFRDQHSSGLGTPGESGVASVGVPGVPGGPAPKYIDADRKASRRVIVPGESTAINFTLKNIWDTRLEVAVQETAKLSEKNWSAEEAIPVTLISLGESYDFLEPGEELTGVVNITPEMSATLEPGKYTLQVDVEIRPLEKSESSHLGFFSGFVVIPPEGVLNATMAVQQRREAHGAGITLEKIHFSAEKTTFETLAAPLTGQVDVPVPFPASVPPIAPIQSQGSEYRAAAAESVITQLTARYRIDGGPWRQPRGRSYRLTDEGIKYEWKIDPVSVAAKRLKIAIVTRTEQDNADAAPWEWTIDLTESN